MNQKSSAVMASVIVPYNLDRGYLAECKRSILGQVTQHSFELILAKGDGSVGYNFNAGLKKAKGRYIKIIAEDDSLTPNCIEDLVNGIQAQQVDWVCANAVNFYLDGNEVEFHSEPQSLTDALGKYKIHGLTTLYRRSVLVAIGGMDESLTTGEEFDMHLKLLRSGHNLGYVDAVVGRHRIWTGNKSTGNRDPMARAERAAYIENIRNRYR